MPRRCSPRRWRSPMRRRCRCRWRCTVARGPTRSASTWPASRCARRCRRPLPRRASSRWRWPAPTKSMPRWPVCRPRFEPWSARPLAERASLLRRAADALQARLPEFCGLLVMEAHKTLGDCVAEVREAVDFCRYYAEQAELRLAEQTLPGPTGESNVLRLHGRGVFVCISPWNFPLAIFAGQVVAALVAGNTVAAKPAEQTPVVARRFVALLHEVGVPVEAVAMPARPRRDRGRRAGGRCAHRRRVLHRQHAGGARDQPRAGGRGGGDRAADRGDRRPQRDGRRQHRVARAGHRRRRAERLSQRRPALLGAAPAVRARRYRRRA